MAAAAITQVSVVNNPAPFHEQIILEVQYECFQALKDDLEWKIIYVGSAESEEYDQVGVASMASWACCARCGCETGFAHGAGAHTHTRTT